MWGNCDTWEGEQVSILYSCWDVKALCTLGLLPCSAPPGKNTKKVVWAGLWWKGCCCISTISWACRRKLKPWWLSSLSTVYGCTGPCVCWMPTVYPALRWGGGNAREHKSWLLSSKVLQPGLDYRVNLQKTFYFRRTIDEAQTPRAMNAWSWRDCWGWGKYPWKVSKGKAVFPLDLSAE